MKKNEEKANELHIIKYDKKEDLNISTGFPLINEKIQK